MPQAEQQRSPCDHHSNRGRPRGHHMPIFKKSKRTRKNNSKIYITKDAILLLLFVHVTNTKLSTHMG